MYCYKCHQQNSQESNYCEHCGTRLLKDKDDNFISKPPTHFFESFSKVTFWPIVIMGIFGGIIGGIWLIFLGQWRLVLFSFILSIILPFAYSLILLVQFPLIALLNKLIEKKRIVLTKITSFITILIGHLVALTWTVLVFTYALMLTPEGKSTLPYLLFGWEIAIGPFQYMASKESKDSLGSIFSVYLLQISYLIMFTLYYLGILPLALPIIVIITIALEIYLLKITFQTNVFQDQDNEV